MRKLKTYVSLGLVSVIVATGSLSFAAVNEIYTVSQLVEKAYDIDLNHITIERTLDDLWKQRNELLGVKNQIQDTLDALEKYKVLYKKNTLTIEDQRNLMIYKAMFGEKPPEYSGQEMLDLYIKNRDFSHANLLLEYTKLENTKNLIKPTLEVNLYNLAMQIVELRDTQTLQKQYESIQKQKWVASKLKYDKGLISKAEYDKLSNETSILMYQIRQLDNNLASLELQINKLTGLDLNSKVTYTNEFLISESYKLKTISEYTNMALINRNEVKNAQLTYDTDKMELEIIKQYLSDQLLTDSINYTNDVIKSESELKLAKANVQKEIVSLYSELIKQDQLLKAQSKVYQKEKKSYDNSKLMYEKGLISKSDFELLTYKYNAAYNTYKTTNRKMGLLLYKMEHATSIGPSSGGK